MSLAGKVIVITGTIDSLVEKFIQHLPIETTSTYVLTPHQKQANKVTNTYGAYGTTTNISCALHIDYRARHILENHHHINYWINFAQTEPPPNKFTQKNLEETFKQYCFPIIIATETAARILLPQRHGTIINIIPAAHNNPLYKTATTAIRTYTATIKQQLEPHNLKVHTFTPKEHPTPYTKNEPLINEEKTAERLIKLIENM